MKKFNTEAQRHGDVAVGVDHRESRVRISDFTAVITGGTPSTREATYWDGGDIPWLPSGVCQNCDVTNADSFITKLGLENSAAKLMPPDTVLIALTGATAGKVGYLTFEASANQSVTGILPSNSHDSKYLFHYLLFRRGKTLSDCYGGAQPHISQGYVKNIEIPLPSLSTQREMAGELDRIVGLKKVAAKVQEKLQLLVKSRFVEMFGDPVSNPKSWDEAVLSDHIVFLTSGSRGWAKYYSDEGELFITIKNVKNSRISIGDVQHITPPQGAEAERTRVKEGDLLISITADLGRTGVVTKEIANRGAYINQHLTRISLKRNAVDPLFLAFYMETDAGKAQFAKKNQSAVKAGLNFDAIKSLKFYLPPLALQREFAAFVAKVEKLEAAAKKAEERLDLLYRSKLQEYFGE